MLNLWGHLKDVEVSQYRPLNVEVECEVRAGELLNFFFSVVRHVTFTWIAQETLVQPWVYLSLDILQSYNFLKISFSRRGENLSQQICWLLPDAYQFPSPTN